MLKSMAFWLGPLTLFLCERYLGTWPYHKFLFWGAIVYTLFYTLFSTLTLNLIPFISHLRLKKKSSSYESQKYRFLSQFLVALSLIVYAVYRIKVGTELSGNLTPETWGDRALLVLWLGGFVVGAFSCLGVELSLRQDGESFTEDPTLVKRSFHSWALMGVFLVALVAYNYGAARRDLTYDWSYLKVTTPSDSTIALVKSYEKPVEIALFFPKDNQVRSYLLEYFEAISQAQPKINLNFYDKDLHPHKAEDFKVSHNGTVIVALEQNETNKPRSMQTLRIGTSLSGARQALKKLDVEFQKIFLTLTASRKNIYFTKGHGEWFSGVQGLGSEDNPLMSLDLMEEFLRGRQYYLHEYSLEGGSSAAVPDDADVVIVFAPSSPFLEAEEKALLEYVKKGGSLFIFMDIDRGANTANTGFEKETPLKNLLSQLGLKYSPIPLAHDQNHVAATRSSADKWFLYSNNFSSHETVSTLSRHDDRVAVLAMRSGSFEVTADADDLKKSSWSLQPNIRSLRGTYRDANQNMKLDPQEKQDTYILGAALEYETLAQDKTIKGRVMVFADGTGFSDGIIRNPGNLLFLSSSLQWLFKGDETSIDLPESEEDVKIRHSRNEDLILFYGSVVFFPILLLVIGALFNRKR